MKNNKRTYMLFLLIILISVTIGYAALNSTLNINGKSNISKNTWNIYFDNVVVKNGSVQAVKVLAINNKTTVNFKVDLNLPGDFYEFTVDVVNKGTIDAMIDSVEKNFVLTESQKKYLNYIIEYDNDEQITSKQLVKKNEFVRLKVRIEYKKDVDSVDLPDAEDVLDLGFTVNYVQADNSANLVSDNGINNLIKFTVDNKKYYAESGMTWGKFVNSKFNVDKFFFDSGYVNLNYCNVLYYSTYLNYSDLIIPDADYITVAIPC